MLSDIIHISYFKHVTLQIGLTLHTLLLLFESGHVDSELI